MIYFLDTNVVIGIINSRSARLRDRLEAAMGESVAIGISSIVLFELWYGIANSNRWEDNARTLRAFLAKPIPVYPFEADDARAAGELRATLNAAGTPIGGYDLLIAAHALRANGTLVTANVEEFSHVPGLKIEDWSV